MQKRGKAVVFLGMSYPSGIVRYAAEVGVALNAQMNGGDIDLYYAALAKENHIGAWDRVRGSFSSGHIITADSFPGLIENVMKLLESYERIVFDIGGGWNQMRVVIPYKRRYKERLQLIVTTHSFANGTWKQVPMSFLQCCLYLKFADKVIFQCPFAARHFFGASLLLRCGKGVIMPLGVLPAQMCGDEMPAVVREKGLEDVLNDSSLFKLIYLAEFREVKNHEWLTRALIPVLREHRNLHVLYCGGDSSAIAQRVRKMVADERLNKQFHIPGVMPRFSVPWVLKHCNCAVVASSSETFGQVYVEALMFGLPVLGTRIGAGEYVLQDFTTGFGFELKSPKGLQDSVRFMIAHPEIAQEMGHRGKTIAESMFSMHNIVCSRVALYQSMFAS